MRALVIEQDDSEKAALVGDALSDRGFALESFVVQPDASLPDGRSDFPDPLRYDLILPMGSPWSVHDPAIEKWCRPQLDLLESATRSGIPVFGICFGAQALAAATGGSVARASAPEIGWCDVSSDVDSLHGRWFQWHQDTFRVGPRATLLAHSSVGQQAFRIGRGVGVQFHPEVSADLLAFWLAGEGGTELEAQGVDPAELLAETRAQDPMLIASRTCGLIDWFLEEVAGS